MPVTRRRRANPPDQPENTNTQSVDQSAGTPTELPTVEQPAVEPAAASEPQSAISHVSASGAPTTPTPSAASVPPTPAPSPRESQGEHQPNSYPASFSGTYSNQSNGERPQERHEYTQSIEGGRRTPRGELFRRPPQQPTPSPQFVTATTTSTSAPLQAPTHEISLPLGNLLHLAYNPGYTGSDEARSNLLQQLQDESKSGGRARCWSCGSLAIVYDRWNTRSKTFGEVGVAFCEICGVWSVM